MLKILTKKQRVFLSHTNQTRQVLERDVSFVSVGQGKNSEPPRGMKPQTF